MRPTVTLVASIMIFRETSRGWGAQRTEGRAGPMCHSARTSLLVPLLHAVHINMYRSGTLWTRKGGTQRVLGGQTAERFTRKYKEMTLLSR